MKRAYEACLAGVGIPVMYFGVQLVALPFAPGYSALKQTASELGMMAVSAHPGVFNVGTGLRAVPVLLATWGMFVCLRGLGAHPVARWITCLAMVSIAINDVGAALFPLPDERHEGVFVAGYFLWPFAMAAAARRVPKSRGLQVYLWLNIALSLGLVAVRAATGPEGSFAWAGLFQRMLAVVSVIPIGVACGVVARRYREVVVLRATSSGAGER